MSVGAWVRGCMVLPGYGGGFGGGCEVGLGWWWWCSPFNGLVSTGRRRLKPSILTFQVCVQKVSIFAGNMFPCILNLCTTVI